MRTSRAFTFCALLLAAGCFATPVRPLNPRPNVDIVHHNESLGISLPKLPNPLKIPARNGVKAFAIKDIEGSLIRGFATGFGKAFTIRDENPDLILQFAELEVEFVPTSNSSIAAQIRFQARIVRDGKIVDRFAGTVESKKSTLNEAEPVLESAIETMYEVIADKLFTHDAPKDAAPATSTSGTSVIYTPTL